MPLKNRIWKNEANQYTVIDDFQNVFAEGLDGLTSLIAGEGRMPGISTGVQSAPAGTLLDKERHS